MRSLVQYRYPRVRHNQVFVRYLKLKREKSCKHVFQDGGDKHGRISFS